MRCVEELIMPDWRLDISFYVCSPEPPYPAHIHDVKNGAGCPDCLLLLRGVQRMFVLSSYQAEVRSQLKNTAAVGVAKGAKPLAET